MKTIKMKRLILLAFVVALPSILSACSCWGPNTFLKSISHLVAEVEYVDFIAPPGQGQASFYDGAPRSLRVIKIYGNKKPWDSEAAKVKVGDTISLLSGDGANCRMVFPRANQGDRFIASLDYEYQYGQFEASKESVIRPQVFSLSLCAEPLLHVTDDQIVGNITKNKIAEISAKSSLYYSRATAHSQKLYKLEPGSIAYFYHETCADFWNYFGEYHSKRIAESEGEMTYLQKWSRGEFERELYETLNS